MLYMLSGMACIALYRSRSLAHGIAYARHAAKRQRRKRQRKRRQRSNRARGSIKRHREAVSVAYHQRRRQHRHGERAGERLIKRRHGV